MSATNFPQHVVVRRDGNVVRALCVRCGLHAAAPKLALLERIVQDHHCKSKPAHSERPKARSSRQHGA